MVEEKVLKQNFISILSRGAKNNTYKFALARFLLDYSIKFGVRKIARFGYENRANTFYDGSESTYSDAATIGKIDGFEFLFETDYKRQEGINYIDQNHFLRYVADNYILKGEYLEDGFADVKYFEASAFLFLNLDRKKNPHRKKESMLKAQLEQALIL